jgi:alkanesulfonate monooxygenase SsuD/methylene tetrahydromethanopterin reductase-like flavin-dependent oxidoreductase (luciferase family)
MIMKAGQLADRVILNLYPSTRIAHALTIIDEGCRKAGRPRPTLSVMIYSYIVGDETKGLEAGRELVSFYASAPAYASLFSSLGYVEEAKAMSEAWKARDKNAVKRLVTPQMIDALTVRGTVQNLRKRVKEYHENGVDDVFICPSPFADYEANVNEVLRHYF